MLNFSIKTPKKKKQLHPSFQMIKFLEYGYSDLVLIQDHGLQLELSKKKKKVFYSQNSLSVFSSLFSLPMDVIWRQFWFSNGGLIVMGPMWSDGLPIFSVLCSLFMGLIVRGSSSSEFHSFNRKFLSLSLSLSLSLYSLR